MPVPVHELRDNRFLVEFDSEWLWKKVLSGGQWTFRDDAVIFVPYDGMQRFSEVVIESIALWIRIYDIPERMMRDDFVRSLGNKVGRVLEIGEARMDYKRVRIDFPLAKPVMAMVQRRVQGRGTMEFKVRYENIPHFCFLCGRISHPERECPEEEEEMDGGVKFGTALRCSPQKWDIGRRITIPAADLKAKTGLNFSGEQKARVMSATNSSNKTVRGGYARHGQRGRRTDGDDAQWRQRENAEDAANLAEGVASMSVDGKEPELGEHMSGCGRQKVSGLDSYFGSSSESGPMKGGYVGMHERLSMAAMDIDKQKRSMKVVTVEAGDQGAGKETGPDAELRGAKQGVSSAKRYKFTPATSANLTGAQDEPRQEQ